MYKCRTCKEPLFSEIDIVRARCSRCWHEKLKKISLQRVKPQVLALDYPIKRGIVFNVENNRLIASNVKHKVNLHNDDHNKDWRNDLSTVKGMEEFSFNILINYVDPLLAYELRGNFSARFLMHYARHNIIPSIRVINWLKDEHYLDDVNLRIKPEDCTN